MPLIDSRQPPPPHFNSVIHSPASLASTPRSVTPAHLSWLDLPAAVAAPDGLNRASASPAPVRSPALRVAADYSSSTSSFDTLADGSGRAEVEGSDALQATYQEGAQQPVDGSAPVNDWQRLHHYANNQLDASPLRLDRHPTLLGRQQHEMQAQHPSPSNGSGGGNLYGAAAQSSAAFAFPQTAQQGLFVPGYSVAMHHQTLNPAVNIGNTRPMTAPSGAHAAPFYYGSYGAQSSFYTPSDPAAGQFAYQPSFQYAVESQLQSPVGSNSMYTTATQLDLAHQQTHARQQQQQQHIQHEVARERGFSLPDIPGLPPHAVIDNGLADDLRYSSGGSDGQPSPMSSNNPFLYAPPAPARALTFPSSTFAATGMPPGIADPRDFLPGSRPTTAESSRPTSSHARGPPPPLQPPLPLRSPYTAIGKPVESNAGPAAKTYNFVASAGQQKRPRRRYDEIERLYACNYPGCTKAYGTLNHLNSHKTMQKHGPRSTPAEFKEMRKKWRENKKREAAEAARQAAAEGKPVDPKALSGPKSASKPATERPRPSTSAGEYHYNVPAPLVPVTTAALPPNPIFGSQQLPLPSAPGFVDPTVTAARAASMYPGDALALPPNAMFVGHNGSGSAGVGMFANPMTSMLDAGVVAGSSSPIRPVTAPNHFGAPSFGYASFGVPHPHDGGGGGGGNQARFSTSVNGGHGPGTIPLAPPRRMSLPGFPSELKQPQPVLGYNGGGLSDVAEAGVGGLTEEDEHHQQIGAGRPASGAKENGIGTGDGNGGGGGVEQVEESGGQLQQV
ncbi:hypothetical protein ACM66B_002075 [Microbotryomycetes sp. NB124-2]